MSYQSDNTIKFPAKLKQRLENTIDRYESSGEDDKKLIDDFSVLLDEGCEEASFYLGSIYEEGLKGITIDLEKALFYYHRSIEYVGDVESYLALGRMKFYGIGVPVDYEKSYEYYSLVERESKNGIASFMLGKFYLDGKYMKRDLSKAREYFQASIKLGYVYAIRYLSDLEKVEDNKVKSLYLKIKAIILTFAIAIKDPRDIRLRAG